MNAKQKHLFLNSKLKWEPIFGETFGGNWNGFLLSGLFLTNIGT